LLVVAGGQQVGQQLMHTVACFGAVIFQQGQHIGVGHATADQEVCDSLSGDLDNVCLVVGDIAILLASATPTSIAFRRAVKVSPSARSGWGAVPQAMTMATASPRMSADV
jgi:hypothetical protein